jgi:uncharacterized damage-inducible protein DinB
MTATMNDVERARAEPAADELPAAVPALLAVLRQLGRLLKDLTDAQYEMKPVGVVSSSIGGHVRHNLDHIDALLSGLDSGLIDYDARERGTEVERSRHAALAALRRQEEQLLSICWPLQWQSLRLSALVTPDGERVNVETSLDRELSFVLSHTIHHNALIGVMAKLLGVRVAATFGYAPSTLAHRLGKTCAR